MAASRHKFTQVREGIMFNSIESLEKDLVRERYIPERSLATVLYLAWSLKKPLFLEGEPGVGKTETAVVMARVLKTDLIRLQCYEGLDANHALYEWNYPRQILAIKLGEECGTDRELVSKTIFTEDFLIKRPLLEAILSSGEREPVLLIDEIDRSDHPKRPQAAHQQVSTVRGSADHDEADEHAHHLDDRFGAAATISEKDQEECSSQADQRACVQ